MKLSTKARYGSRLMVVLAENWGRGHTILRDIAKQEDLSEKYLSLIVIPLRAAGLIQSVRGSQGGYMLARPPEEITMAEIVHVLEGNTCLVNCVERPDKCPRSGECVMRNVWVAVGQSIDEALESVTLATLIETSAKQKRVAARRKTEPVQQVTS